MHIALHIINRMDFLIQIYECKCKYLELEVTKIVSNDNPYLDFFRDKQIKDDNLEIFQSKIIFLLSGICNIIDSPVLISNKII